MFILYLWAVFAVFILLCMMEDTFVKLEYIAIALLWPFIPITWLFISVLGVEDFHTIKHP